jgi:hypothetical protein
MYRIEDYLRCYGLIFIELNISDDTSIQKPPTAGERFTIYIYGVHRATTF